MRKIAASCALLLACMAGAPLAHAVMFKCIGNNGSVTYQEVPCPQTGDEKKLKEVPAGPPGAWKVVSEGRGERPQSAAW